MAIKDLKRELRIKSSILNVCNNTDDIDIRVYNYLGLLENEGSKYTIKILDLIATIDTKGYEELTYQLAISTIKSMPVVVKPVEKADPKEVDIKKESTNSVKELLEKIRKERGK